MCEQQRWAVAWNAIQCKEVGVVLVAAVISSPSFAETSALNEIEVAAKLICRSNVSGKDARKGGVQSVPAKPSERGGVDGAAKGGGSTGGPAFEVVAPIDVPNKCSQQNSADDGVGVGEEGFHHMQYLVVVVIALAPLLFGTSDTPPLKPNG